MAANKKFATALAKATKRGRHSPAGYKYLQDKKKKKKDTVPTYFRGKAFERESIESRLRKAGIDPARFKSRKKK